MLDKRNPVFSTDEVYLNLADMMQNLDELENVGYNRSNEDECIIMKAAGILLNKQIYTDSFAQIQTLW